MHGGCRRGRRLHHCITTYTPHSVESLYLHTSFVAFISVLKLHWACVQILQNTWELKRTFCDLKKHCISAISHASHLNIFIYIQYRNKLAIHATWLPFLLFHLILLIIKHIQSCMFSQNMNSWLPFPNSNQFCKAGYFQHCTVFWPLSTPPP